jgi:hypothetical protein
MMRHANAGTVDMRGHPDHLQPQRWIVRTPPATQSSAERRMLQARQVGAPLSRRIDRRGACPSRRFAPRSAGDHYRMSKRRWLTDHLGLTRPSGSGPPPTGWRPYLLLGFFEGAVFGLVFQLWHSGFSAIGFGVCVAVGVLVFAPLVRWSAMRKWREGRREQSDATL